MWLFSNSRSCPSFQKVASGRSNELDNFVSLFDESYNKTVKKGQMGLHKRFWNEESNTVCTRYYTSEFMGKAAAPDILKMFKSCMTGLNDEKTLQVSMDGPNENKDLLSMLNEEHQIKNQVCSSTLALVVSILSMDPYKWLPKPQIQT